MDAEGEDTGITGNVTGITGNLDDCNIADEDKQKGINITDLII